MLKRNFYKGRMNLDTDERMLEQGEYREAENIDVINSEGSDVGAVEKNKSNRLLTHIDLGLNAKGIGKFENRTSNKIYWFVKSDTACFLLEWDDNTQSMSVVLHDSRPEGERVLDLKDDHLITGIDIVLSEDGEDDLLLASDDNIEPLCININRAKSYGENGFEREDIYLIKRPPLNAPQTTLILDGTESNFIEDKFFLFAYRYKYLDGEWSALSNYSPYCFEPKGYYIDYFNLENSDMVNAYNAINVKFNTGDKRVTDIQVVTKQTNSNTLFVAETFSKSDEGWGDNQDKNFNFYNNKLYTVLPEKELFRLFDNVPLKAKALTLVNNIPVFGNYLEGRDMIDAKGNPVIMNFTTKVNSYDLNEGVEFDKTIIDNGVITSTVNITDMQEQVFNIGFTLRLFIKFTIATYEVFENVYSLQLTQNYVNMAALFDSSEFQIFLSAINNDIQANYNAGGEYDIPDGHDIFQDPYLEVDYSGGIGSFILYPIKMHDTLNENAVLVEETWFYDFSFSLQKTGLARNCKTNRPYEVGVVYKDDFLRATTVQTAYFNSVYIPQLHSTKANRLEVSIANKPPIWAKKYAFVVKTPRLAYHNIFINQFFQDDNYTWCKLEGDNKDKVKAGDLLIPKCTPVPESNVNYIKVLEVTRLERDFVIANLDGEGNEIIEPAGLYMKIRPDGLSMDSSDFKIYQSEDDAKASTNDHQPNLFLDCFSITEGEEENTVAIDELFIPKGSYIELEVTSKRTYSFGERTHRLDLKVYAQRDYDTVEEWVNEYLLGQPLYFKVDETDEYIDYSERVWLKRGYWDAPFGSNVPYTFFHESENGGLTLHFRGQQQASASRSVYMRGRFLIRTSIGEYIFETYPTPSEEEIYYEVSDNLDIVDGAHTGNVQNQDLATNDPAVHELDFFNSFSFGNGLESYRIRDAFNDGFLHIDSRPTTTSIEPYKQIRRFADWTYGEPYIESVGINGLNVFNLSTAPFKEGDKQYGSVQKLFARNTDLVSLHERKAFKVLFGKDMINTANGEGIISKVPQILGQAVPFQGDNGIGKYPESFAMDAFRAYYVSPENGVPIRLSIDGTEDINYGMVGYFRDTFAATNGAKKIGGFDPYKGHYALTIEDAISKMLIANCGNIIYKRISEPFTYQFEINDLYGEINLQYQVISGSISIQTDYNGIVETHSQLGNNGVITIVRDDLEANIVTVTINPWEENTIFAITNLCPIGTPLKITTVVLCDQMDIGRTIVLRHRWADETYSENHLFEVTEVSKFTTEEGLEGVGKYPNRNEEVSIESFKGSLNTAEFDMDSGNGFAYLVSDQEYTEETLQELLDNCTWLDISEVQLGVDSFLHSGQFNFDRPTDNHNLYLVYDYRNSSITVDTHIRFVFDSSGSMNDTLAPLNEMRDTLLKDALLPFYGYDEDLYNEKVSVVTFGTERTLQAMNMDGDTPEGNAIVMVFQDETTNGYGVSSGWTSNDALHGNYVSDLGVFRGRLDGFASNYYKGCIFQVANDGYSGANEFKAFVQAIDNGLGNYAGTDGLSDRPEIEFEYDVTNGGTAQYYMDLILQKLADLGISI